MVYRSPIKSSCQVLLWFKMVCWIIYGRFGKEMKKTDLEHLALYWFVEYMRLRLKSMRILEIKSFFGVLVCYEFLRERDYVIFISSLARTSQKLVRVWGSTDQTHAWSSRDTSWVGGSCTSIHTRANVWKFLETKCSLWRERGACLQSFY